MKVREVKLSYKATESRYNQFNGSPGIAKILMDTWDKDTIGFKESFKAVLLNSVLVVVTTS